MKLNSSQKSEVIKIIRQSHDKAALCELLDSLNNFIVHCSYSDDYIVTVTEDLYEMYVVLFTDEEAVVNIVSSSVKQYLSKYKIYNVYLNHIAYDAFSNIFIASNFKSKLTCFDVLTTRPIRYDVSEPEVPEIESIRDILGNCLKEYDIQEDNPMSGIIFERVSKNLVNQAYRVLTCKDIVVSQLFLVEDDKDVFIKAVLTPYKNRGNGYAEKLLQQVINSYYGTDSVLHLSVSQYNGVAQRLYPRLGFVKTNNLYMYTLI